MVSPSPQCVGQEFVRQYYTMLHEAPDFMHRFYSHDSSYIHGGLEKSGDLQVSVHGQTNIHKKILSLNFRDCHARIRQVDSLGTIDNAVVVQVSGELSNEGRPMRKFMQTFVLAPQSPKKYYVHNDIFRYQDEVFTEERVSELSVPVQVETIASTTSYCSGSSLQVNPPLQVVATPFINCISCLQPPVQPQVLITSTSPSSIIEGEADQGKNLVDLGMSLPEETTDSLKSTNDSLKCDEPSMPIAIQKLDESENFNCKDGSVAVNDSEGGRANGCQGDGIKNGSAEVNRNTNGSSLPPTSYPSGQEYTKNLVSWATLTANGKNGAPLSIARSDAGGRIENENYSCCTSIEKSPVCCGQHFGEMGLGQFSDGGGGCSVEFSHKHHGSIDHVFPGAERIQVSPTKVLNNDGNSWEAEALPRPHLSDQLFVGNLPNDISNVALKNFFSKFGEVTELRVNKKVSLNRDVPNFGFVRFKTRETAGKVLESRPLYLDNGHRLNVEEKRSDQMRLAAGGCSMAGLHRYSTSPSSGRGAWWVGYKGNGIRMGHPPHQRLAERIHHGAGGHGSYHSAGRVRHD